MKKNRIFLGFIVILTIIGMLFMACSDGGGSSSSGTGDGDSDGDQSTTVKTGTGGSSKAPVATYKIAFDLDDGSNGQYVDAKGRKAVEIATITGKALGATIESPGVITMNSNKFMGWSTTKGGRVDVINLPTKLTTSFANRVLYPVWDSDNTYTIKLDKTSLTYTNGVPDGVDYEILAYPVEGIAFKCNLPTPSSFRNPSSYSGDKDPSLYSEDAGWTFAGILDAAGNKIQNALINLDEDYADGDITLSVKWTGTITIKNGTKVADAVTYTATLGETYSANNIIAKLETAWAEDFDEDAGETYVISSIDSVSGTRANGRTAIGASDYILPGDIVTVTYSGQVVP